MIILDVLTVFIINALAHGLPYIKLRKNIIPIYNNIVSSRRVIAIRI